MVGISCALFHKLVTCSFFTDSLPPYHVGCQGFIPLATASCQSGFPEYVKPCLHVIPYCLLGWQAGVASMFVLIYWLTHAPLEGRTRENVPYLQQTVRVGSRVDICFLAGQSLPLQSPLTSPGTNPDYCLIHSWISDCHSHHRQQQHLRHSLHSLH